MGADGMDRISTGMSHMYRTIGKKENKRDYA